MTRDQAMLLVLGHRHEQDFIHGAAPERGYTHGEWLSVLVEEVGEVAKAINDMDSFALCEELVQVAAVAVAMLEALIES
jgi:NTP pyrophosphatase (non-canonical NTP hydrolase)